MAALPYPSLTSPRLPRFLSIRTLGATMHVCLGCILREITTFASDSLILLSFVYVCFYDTFFLPKVGIFVHSV